MDVVPVPAPVCDLETDVSEGLFAACDPKSLPKTAPTMRRAVPASMVHCFVVSLNVKFRCGFKNAIFEFIVPKMALPWLCCTGGWG